MISSLDSCVRITPDSYSYNPTPTPQKKSLSEELSSSFNKEVIGELEKDVIGTADSQFNNPFDPNAPKLQAAASTITVGTNGASSGSSGPSLAGTAFNALKWFFGTALPTVARSEPVQAAVTAVTAAVKAVTVVVSSIVNWFKSWF
jgi:hypothetical protein